MIHAASQDCAVRLAPPSAPFSSDLQPCGLWWYDAVRLVMSSPSAPRPSPVIGRSGGGEGFADNPGGEASDLPSGSGSGSSSFKRRSTEVRFSCLPGRLPPRLPQSCPSPNDVPT